MFIQETSISLLTPRLCYSLFHLKRIQSKERKLEQQQQLKRPNNENKGNEEDDDDNEGFDPETELCAGSLQKRPLEGDNVRRMVFNKGTGKFSKFQEQVLLLAAAQRNALGQQEEDDRRGGRPKCELVRLKYSRKERSAKILRKTPQQQ